MPFSLQRRVEFRDTDAAGIVHFSAFFPMMETAEHEMLRSIGVPVHPRHGGQEDPVTWPRMAASCDYRAAAHFEDMLRIDVHVARIGASSIRYEFRFTRDGELIAEGTMTAVCCRRRVEGGLEKHPIPESIRQRLEAG